MLGAGKLRYYELNSKIYRNKLSGFNLAANMISPTFRPVAFAPYTVN